MPSSYGLVEEVFVSSTASENKPILSRSKEYNPAPGPKLWCYSETSVRSQPCQAWESILESTRSSFLRHGYVLNEKIQSWKVSYEEIQRPLESPEGLLDYFEQSGVAAKQKIAQLRATRINMDHKKKEQRDEDGKKQMVSQKSADATKEAKLPQTAEPEKPKKDIDGASRGPDENGPSKDKKTTALKRFEEISEIAKPAVEAAKRFEQIKEGPLKDARLKMRIGINKRVVQIANSLRQVGNVVHELLMILDEAWRKGGNELLHYCIYVLANKLIEQAETQISLHPPSAFSTAKVIVDISMQQKGLLPVLVYLIMCRCPYAIPRYVERGPSQSEQDHKIAMGYTVTEGTIESEQPYTERMAGIVCLYGAIVQAKPTIGGESPFGIQNGWLWLASVLNIKPHSITPYIICSFLESAGYDLWKKYGEHYIKILRFMRTNYLAMIPKGSISAKTRLELYLNKVFTNPERPVVPIPEGAEILP